MGNAQGSGGRCMIGHIQQLVLPANYIILSVLIIPMRLNKISQIIHFGFSSRRFHQILGVSINATSQQIKTAYYRMAKAHHPDLNPSQTATKFHEIKNAYEQLTKNPTAQTHPKQKSKQKTTYKEEQKETKKQQTKKRTQKQDKWSGEYQQFVSENSFNEQDFWDFQQSQLRQFQKAFNSYLRNGFLNKKYMKFKPYFQQIFEKGTFNFQNESFAKQFRNQSKKNKTKRNYTYDQQSEYQNSHIKDKFRVKKLDITQNVNVEQDYIGERIKVKFQRQINCHKCDFNPQQNVVKQHCKYCKKKDINQSAKCPNCRGKGFTTKYQCKTCKNKGFIRKVVQQTIQIPLGVEDGCRIVIEGHGHQHRKKGTYGDLIIKVNIVNSFKTKKQNNKKQKQAKPGESWIEISMFEAVLGCITTVKSGKNSCQIRIPPGIQHGDTIKNVPRNYPNKFKINFTVPSNISSKQKEIFQKLKQLSLRSEKSSRN